MIFPTHIHGKRFLVEVTEHQPVFRPRLLDYKRQPIQAAQQLLTPAVIAQIQEEHHIMELAEQHCHD